MDTIMEFIKVNKGASHFDIKRTFGEEGIAETSRLVKEGKVIKSYDGVGRRRVVWYDEG